MFIFSFWVITLQGQYGVTAVISDCSALVSFQSKGLVRIWMYLILTHSIRISLSDRSIVIHLLNKVFDLTLLLLALHTTTQAFFEIDSLKKVEKGNIQKREENVRRTSVEIMHQRTIKQMKEADSESFQLGIGKTSRGLEATSEETNKNKHQTRT